MDKSADAPGSRCDSALFDVGNIIVGWYQSKCRQCMAGDELFQLSSASVDHIDLVTD